jgi:hypothetical protein
MSDIYYENFAANGAGQWAADFDFGYDFVAKEWRPGAHEGWRGFYDDIYATVATNEHGTLVGIHVYMVRDGIMQSCFTYVNKRFRRMGVAESLWTISLSSDDSIEEVRVSCVTPESRAMIDKIRAATSSIEWFTEEVCE